MLQPTTFSFLKNLKKNNNKQWFDENRKAYEAAKADFEVFVTEILAQLSKTEPAFKELAAKDCIFRIFRDVRFSKDKTPYKSHFGAYFIKGGKKETGGGYYLHLEPGAIFIGGGMWMPENDVLKKLRQEIDYNFDEFKKILNAASFKKTYGSLSNEDKLKTLPKGYVADNPAIEYLKLKSFTASSKMDDKTLADKGAAATCAKTMQAMRPFIDFLNRSVA